MRTEKYCLILKFDIMSFMSAIGGPVSSAISSAANITSTEMTNKANLQIARETNEANAKLAKEQNDFNYKMWQENNDYNDPAKQVERLKGAGLSDAAAAGAIDGAGNSAGAVTSANLANQQLPPALQVPQIDPNSFNVLGAMREIMAYRKETAEAQKSEAQAEVFPRLLLSQEDIMNADLALKRQEWQNTFETFPYQVRIWRAKAKAEAKMPAYIQAQTESHKANVQQAEMNVKLARQQFDFLEKMNDKQIEEMCERIKNLQTERDNLLAARKVMGAQASYLEAQTASEGIKKELLNEQVYTTKLDNVFKEYGSPDDTAGRMAALLASGQLKSIDLFNSMLGLRQVVMSGHKILSVSPETKEFLYNYWDKGSMNANQLTPKSYGFWSNGLNNVADALRPLF